MSVKSEETSDNSGYETVSESDEEDEINLTCGAKGDPIDELIGAVTRCQIQYSILSKEVSSIFNP